MASEKGGGRQSCRKGPLIWEMRCCLRAKAGAVSLCLGGAGTATDQDSLLGAFCELSCRLQVWGVWCVLLLTGPQRAAGGMDTGHSLYLLLWKPPTRTSAFRPPQKKQDRCKQCSMPWGPLQHSIWPPRHSNPRYRVGKRPQEGRVG